MLSRRARLDGSAIVGAPWTWMNSRTRRFPLGTAPEHVGPSTGPGRWYRAVAIRATPDVVFLWLSQLRRAPYSYDLLDNFGRRSPRHAEPELVDISPGDSVMTIFSVVEVEDSTGFVLRFNRPRWARACGDLSIRYELSAIPGGTLLAVDMIVPLPPGPFRRLRRYALAWGDLLMMRKQLLTLAQYAETS